MRGLVADKRLQMSVRVEPEVEVVSADPTRVKQILYNYLSNASKFTREGGRISVHIAPEDADFFRIDVEDTGIGIPAGQIDRLFAEFHQLDAGSGKKLQGTRLGLNLTKRIAEAHGGRVQVRSVVGKGSVFSAILPRAFERAPVARSARATTCGRRRHEGQSPDPGVHSRARVLWSKFKQPAADTQEVT